MEDNYIPFIFFTHCVSTKNKQKKLNIAVLQEKCVDFHEKYIACKDKEQVKTKALIRWNLK